MQLITIVCPSLVGLKKNLNNFKTEAATHPEFAPLESSREAVKNIPSVCFQNPIESAIPKLNTKVYGNRKNHKFPAQNAPAFSQVVRLN